MKIRKRAQQKILAKMGAKQRDKKLQLQKINQKDTLFKGHKKEQKTIQQATN